ncbi:MAG: hypothetical protein ABJI93_10360 [Nonlabens ulvanivorans]|uniref:hypothetical protein n=1 Tax=Nonlabens ulvanivorans TaxID=906888 RepID=UPI0032987218
MKNEDFDIKQETAIKTLLNRMPENVADSFTSKQLMHLKLALGARKWGSHKIDIRGTFIIPFKSKRFYYVFLMGRNSRELSRNEKKMTNLGVTLFTSCVLLGFVFFVLLILYILKSALGINLFQSYSLGIWGWLKGFFG